MEKGIAELFDSESGSRIGSLEEEFAKEASATVKVELNKAIMLAAGASLRIYGPSETAVNSKIVTGSAHDLVKEVRETSSMGYLPEKTHVGLGGFCLKRIF